MTPEAQRNAEAALLTPISDEYDAALAASMAHMSDRDIQYWIDRLTAERSAPLYALMVSSKDNDINSTELFRYRRELARRHAAVRNSIQTETKAA